MSLRLTPNVGKFGFMTRLPRRMFTQRALGVFPLLFLVDYLVAALVGEVQEVLRMEAVQVLPRLLSVLSR